MVSSQVYWQWGDVRRAPDIRSEVELSFSSFTHTHRLSETQTAARIPLSGSEAGTGMTPGFLPSVQIQHVIPAIAVTPNRALHSRKPSNVYPSSPRRIQPAQMIMTPPEPKAPLTEESAPSEPLFVAPVWRGPAIAALWVALLVYSLAFAPGDLTDAGTIGMILRGQFGDVNDLLLAVFNALGQIGAVYASLLLPASSRQKLWPTTPFAILGMLFGFVGLGPYLAVRTYAPDITADEVRGSSAIVRWFEGKANAVLLLAHALYIFSLAFGFFAPAEMRDVIFYACWQNTAQLFGTDRSVHVMLLDGAVLSTLVYGPLTEDMRRRGWKFDKDNISSYLNAFCVLAAPCIGPAVYLMLRPGLPEAQSSVSKSSASSA
jgi:hypothetical protein